MAHHDDDLHGDSSHDGFHDESGFLTIFLGLVVMVGMTCLPATSGSAHQPCRPSVFSARLQR